MQATQLSDKEQNVLRIVRDMVRDKYPQAQLFLYGSRAKGKAKNEPYEKTIGRGANKKTIVVKGSDYDVSVLLPKGTEVNLFDLPFQRKVTKAADATVMLRFCTADNAFNLMDFTNI